LTSENKKIQPNNSKYFVGVTRYVFDVDPPGVMNSDNELMKNYQRALLFVYFELQALSAGPKSDQSQSHRPPGNIKSLGGVDQMH
jgi:hypothetical protein